jgi:hypothetical protein
MEKQCTNREREREERHGNMIVVKDTYIHEWMA